MQQAGAKMVGVIEREGSIYSTEGIDADKLEKFKALKGSIINFPGSETFKD